MITLPCTAPLVRRGSSAHTEEHTAAIQTPGAKTQSRFIAAILATLVLGTAVYLAAQPAHWFLSALFAAGIYCFVFLGTLSPSWALKFATSLSLATLLAAKILQLKLLKTDSLLSSNFDHDVLFLGFPEVPIGLLVAVALSEASGAALWRRRKRSRALRILIVFLGTACLFFVAEGLLWWFAGYDDSNLNAMTAALLVIGARGLAHVGGALRRRCSNAPAVGGLAAALLLVVVGQLGILWLGIRAPRAAAPTPMALAHQCRENLSLYYPHWKEDPSTLDGKWDRYKSRLLRGAAVCHDDQAPCYPVLRELRDMFAELSNGHTGVYIPSDSTQPPIELGLTDRGVAIEWVAPGSDAEASGLVPGLRVVAVDGVSVAEAVAQVPSWMAAYASPRTRLLMAIRHVLIGPAGTPVTLTVDDGASSVQDVELRRADPLPDEVAQLLLNDDDYVSGEVLEDGLGYIVLYGFSGPGLVSKFDRALRATSAAPGLIIDLRDNGGGNLQNTLTILGRLFHDRVSLGDFCRVIYVGREGFFYCQDVDVEPVETPYRGRLAVLIGEDSFSAGEIAAYALCRLDRARCFGRATSGETDTVSYEGIPGALVGISTAMFVPETGEEIQGSGVEPHERVDLRLEDLRQGRDAALEAAREWLLTGASLALHPAAMLPGGT